MVICFENKSILHINVCFGETYINLSSGEKCMHKCEFEHMPIEVKFSVSDKDKNIIDDTNCCFHISTIVLCDFKNSSNPRFVINVKTNRFQNYTSYQYLKIDSFDIMICENTHIVDNYDTVRFTKVHIKKKKIILHILKKSFLDMLLEGFLLSILLAWVFSWIVAIFVLLAIFVIALIVNMIKLRTSKSKYRILNWDKDMDMPDDIEYFIANIDKYCR